MRIIKSSSGLSEFCPSGRSCKVIQDLPLFMILNYWQSDNPAFHHFRCSISNMGAAGKCDGCCKDCGPWAGGFHSELQQKRPWNSTGNQTRSLHYVLMCIYWEVQLWKITVDLKYSWPFLWDNWWHCNVLHADFENLTFVNMECSRAGCSEIHARTT